MRNDMNCRDVSRRVVGNRTVGECPLHEVEVAAFAVGVVAQPINDDWFADVEHTLGGQICVVDDRVGTFAFEDLLELHMIEAIKARRTRSSSVSR